MYGFPFSESKTGEQHRWADGKFEQALDDYLNEGSTIFGKRKHKVGSLSSGQQLAKGFAH